MKILLRKKTVLIILFFVFEILVFLFGRWSVPSEIVINNLQLPPEVSEGPKSLPKTYLLILIMSSPDDLEIRETVRRTWLKLSMKGPSYFRAIFPIGIKNIEEEKLSKLKAENETFGDLVYLSEVTESCEKLAKKTAESINYGVKNFDFEYLLKVDSDSFVRVGAVLKSLRDIAHPRLYWGFLDGRAKPFRTGKWKEVDWMLCDRYLPYQLGGGYVISYQLAAYISKNLKLLKYYVSEDVSVGVWLAGVDTKYVHDPRFDTEFQSRGCNNEYLITHKKSPKQMVALFANLQQTGRLCLKEFQTRPSYVYDFSVPPSQCCTRRNNSGIP